MLELNTKVNTDYIVISVNLFSNRNMNSTIVDRRLIRFDTIGEFDVDSKAEYTT